VVTVTHSESTAQQPLQLTALVAHRVMEAPLTPMRVSLPVETAPMVSMEWAAAVVAAVAAVDQL
jgi:hypothetical protein